MEALAEKVASLEARLHLLEQKCQKPSSKNSTASATPSGDGVLLSVGGKQFTSTLSTLRQAGEGTFLHCVASSEDRCDDRACVPFRKDAKGAICIDRSPKHFAKILDFLRCGPAFVRPKSLQDCDEILAEARFFGLDELAVVVDRLRMPWFTDVCGVRCAETRVKFTSNGRFCALLTVPDPQNFYLSVRLERSQGGTKRPRGDNKETPIQERYRIAAASPWRHVSAWSLALLLQPRQTCPGTKTVLLPDPKRTWCPQDDDFKVVTPYQYVRLAGPPAHHPDYNPDHCRDETLYASFDSMTAPERRLLPGQTSPYGSEQGEAGNLSSLEALEHWKLHLHSTRPGNAKMPPLPEKKAEVVLLNKLFDKRGQRGDRLEMWPETALLSATIPDLGTSCTQIVGCSAERRAEAGARVTRVDGTEEVYWVSWKNQPIHDCLIIERDGVASLLPEGDPRVTVVASLSLRVSLGDDGKGQLRVSRDGADFMKCATPDILGQELLCSLDWGGSAGPDVVFESMRT